MTGSACDGTENRRAELVRSQKGTGSPIIIKRTSCPLTTTTTNSRTSPHLPQILLNHHGAVGYRIHPHQRLHQWQAPRHKAQERRSSAPDVGGRDPPRARARRAQVSIPLVRPSRCVLSPTEPTAPTETLPVDIGSWKGAGGSHKHSSSARGNRSQPSFVLRSVFLYSAVHPNSDMRFFRH